MIEDFVTYSNAWSIWFTGAQSDFFDFCQTSSDFDIEKKKQQQKQKKTHIFLFIYCKFYSLDVCPLGDICENMTNYGIFMLISNAVL